MKLNILITGSDGQLGSEFKALKLKYLEYNFIFKSKSSLDITDYKFVKNFVTSNDIYAIVNCAAYTNVYKAQNNKKSANRINNLAVCNLGNVCQEFNIKLVHISTDYVFDGSKKESYKELDLCNPKTSYGESKLLGELSLINIKLPNSIIIRTSWLYSNFGNNFVTKIIKKIINKEPISVVSDQFGSPTYAKDLAIVVLSIIPNILNNNTELYHYSNTGLCSWNDFATKIVDLTTSSVEVSSHLSANKDILRPKRSQLNCDKIVMHFGVELKNWNESLKNCINTIINKNKLLIK